MSSATKSDRLQFAGPAQQAGTPALIIVLYAAAVCLLFLAVLGYAVGFFAGFGVPKGIDQGPRAAVPVAVVIDLLLLSLFAVQHTVMARPWFKRRWTRIVPARPVPAHPSSPDGRFRDHLLGGAHHDGRPRAPRGRRDRLHRCRHRSRNTT
jgi:hypothetical protein